MAATDTDLEPAAPALTKTAAAFKAKLSAVADIKPEWQEIGDQIAALYRQERQDSPVGRLAFIADPSAVASLLTAVDVGLTPQQAANTLGHAPSTITKALTQAEQDSQNGLQSAHVAFSQACQMAKDRRRMRILGGIEAAGSSGPQFWTALAWLGERTYGQDYKLQQDTGRGNVIVQVGIVASGDVKVGLVEGDSAARNVLDGVVIPTTAE